MTRDEAIRRGGEALDAKYPQWTWSRSKWEELAAVVIDATQETDA